MTDKFYEIVYIREDYFIKNSHFVEMLDYNNIDKQTSRSYLFLKFKYLNNNVLVPLRSEISPTQKYGHIGYPVPSKSKPNAGLDFRKILIINNLSYIEFTQVDKIPKSQQRIIEENFEKIKTSIFNYINKYIKAALKNREKIDNLCKFSTLHNFHIELGINKIKQEISKAAETAAPTKERE